MLWLCLRFPCLALEVFPPESEPAVVVALQRVQAANEAAQAAGIQPGLRLAAALALAPGVLVHERQPAREAAWLHMLACWSEAFTPQVSLAAEGELLLEIGGCLRLFGGLPALRERVRAGLAEQGSFAVQGLAPTPRAAQWLARAGVEEACLEVEALPAALAPLPVQVVEGFTPAQQRTLAALGVRSLGDLLVLPAAGLQRRFGAGLPLQLAQALGERPDPRAAFIFPEHFAERLELPAKVSEAAMLLFALRRLLAALAGWLAARASGLSSCRILLEHEDGLPASELPLNFAEPTADLARFERVLRERLEHYRLTAPVWRVQVLADEAQPLAGRSLGLFGQEAAQALAPVIERLRARLGEAAVHGLACVADHRPECASRAVPEAQAGVRPAVAGTRPLWLLPRPQALGERAGVPQHEGAILRLAGPERIESGWWSEVGQGGDVTRDYFVASNPRGEWLWVFRDAQGWWLHGLFA
ncbi:Y-family DNA polymerase [Uliginosibacterium aquaticum]|uniref:DNA polymerase Y family protein n=1 Tax=Uliginosibacterium aquaticum TaxID=2731212 RepID=A0ABX2IFL9_9RHOO|nr:DNA polymerase Y family protein [Uliginosibacterium aquaticum]NSL55476.1 DNA polymerase Y family protein [Uliginosibacterium aquaticum]